MTTWHLQLVICLASLVGYLGCDGARSASDEVENEALRIIEFSDLSKNTDTIIALAKSGNIGEIDADAIERFIAEAQVVEDYGDNRVTAYRMMLPQKRDTVKPMDGSKGVPCWPELMIIVQNLDRRVERVIVTVQCL